jgi:hypothetical protein
MDDDVRNLSLTMRDILEFVRSPSSSSQAGKHGFVNDEANIRMLALYSGVHKTGSYQYVCIVVYGLALNERQMNSTILIMGGPHATRFQALLALPSTNLPLPSMT